MAAPCKFPPPDHHSGRKKDAKRSVNRMEVGGVIEGREREGIRF